MNFFFWSKLWISFMRFMLPPHKNNKLKLLILIIILFIFTCVTERSLNSGGGFVHRLLCEFFLTTGLIKEPNISILQWRFMNIF